VDDIDALSLEPAKKAIQRAIHIKMETYEPETGDVNHYTGQAGIVGMGAKNWFVTAMHNISSGINDGRRGRPGIRIRNLSQ
jgi:hypothetical protein